MGFRPTTITEDRELEQAIANMISVDADSILDWVKSNFNVEDVFDREDLEAWAENEGYKIMGD